MPLTQTLISPYLACAFNITADGARELQTTSESAFAALPHPGNSSSSLDAHPSSSTQEIHGGVSFGPEKQTGNEGHPGSFADCEPAIEGLNFRTGLWDQGGKVQISIPQHENSSPGCGNSGSSAPMVYLPLEGRTDNGNGGDFGGADSGDFGGEGSSRKPKKRLDMEFEESESNTCLENSNEEPAARTLKRPRLVWTPQLHKRFVDAVSHLGIKNAVPKTIMQLMNVEGLTRENVASHLQKYRLYLKRTQGLSLEGLPLPDQLFGTTSVPPPFAASAHFLSHNGEDVLPLLMPMSMAGIGHPHMVGPAVSYPNFDPHIYSALARQPSQRPPSSDQEYVMDNQGRQGSPQKRVLTLFPSSGQ